MLMWCIVFSLYFFNSLAFKPNVRCTVQTSYQINALECVPPANVGVPYCAKDIRGEYDIFPHTLFVVVRSKKSPKVKLRERSTQKARGKNAYDYVAVDGKICPLPNKLRLDGWNGLALKPNSMTQYSFVEQSSSSNLYAVIPEGTPVPFGTKLIHEYGHSFSLQAAAPMEVEIFNAIASAFLTKMKILSREEWLDEYHLGTQIGTL